MADLPTFNGVSLDQWRDAFRPGMPEYAATRFTFTSEGDFVRIAFGNEGPFIDEQGSRSPRHTNAVTLSPEVAVELARLILANYAKPETT